MTEGMTLAVSASKIQEDVVVAQLAIAIGVLA